MENDSSLAKVKESHGRLFLPSLAMSNFATGPLGVLLGLLLIDISLSFGVSVGVMGQVNTVSYVVAVVFGLLMGVLSVRFRQKSLLLTGLLCVSVSALGCFVASSFSLMLISYSLSGVATAMVFPMVTTLIGEHFPLEKRGAAVGWIIAAGSLSYLVGAPIVSVIAGVGGWRFVLVGFVIPVSLVALFLAFVSVPSASRGGKLEAGKGAYVGGFRGVLSSKSATACLIGNVLRTASFVAILLYGVSFFRQRFSVSTDSASVIVLGAALLYTLASLFAGRLINRVGRKPLTVLTTLVSGVFIASFFFLPNLWFSLILNFLGTWFSGMGSSAANSLALEQVPEFRSTMMSINSAAISFGNALGSAIGGVALVLLDYEAVGTTLGALGIIAATIFYFLAGDQCLPESPKA